MDPLDLEGMATVQSREDRQYILRTSSGTQIEIIGGEITCLFSSKIEDAPTRLRDLARTFLELAQRVERR